MFEHKMTGSFNYRASLDLLRSGTNLGRIQTQYGFFGSLSGNFKESRKCEEKAERAGACPVY